MNVLCKINEFNTKFYYILDKNNNEILHNINNEPSIIFNNGTKYWYEFGLFKNLISTLDFAKEYKEKVIARKVYEDSLRNDNDIAEELKQKLRIEKEREKKLKDKELASQEFKNKSTK